MSKSAVQMHCSFVPEINQCFVNEYLLSLTTMQLGMPHSLQPLAYDRFSNI